MCDYSLHALRNRLANEGERLVVHRFYTGSIGLAPQSEEPEQQAKPGFWRKFFRLTEAEPPACAVCIPPGARLLVHQIPARLRRQFGIEETEEVTFTQLTARENAYRDAVRFRSGATLLLQQLEPGQTVKVITLSGAEEEQPEPVIDSLVA